MPSIKITRSTLERLQPALGETVYYRDELLKGFAVRVSPQGVKTYVVQGRIGHDKNPSRVTLGRWPVLSPEEARELARAALTDMLAGNEPGARRQEVTAGGLMDEWLDVHVARKLKPRTAADYAQIVNGVLKPTFGSKPVAAVARADLAKMHHDRRSTPRRANYCLAVAKSFFTYAEEAGHRPMESNPARRIRTYPERKRERYLSSDETAGAAAAIANAEATGTISIFAAAGLRLCLLTGARQGEIRTLRWREVDLERRILLLDDSKTGRRTIYLNAAACAVLGSVPRLAGNEYVICGASKGEPYKNLSRAWIKIRGGAGLDDVRLHDLRHTFASVAAAESVSLPMIGNMLGHSVPATTARYAHLAADPVRQANERVGTRLAEMMAGRKAPAEKQPDEMRKPQAIGGPDDRG